MKQSLLGSFPSCLMAPSLILLFKPGTSHVNHPKILFKIMVFWQSVYLLISCCETGVFFFMGMPVSLLNILWRCKIHLFLLAFSPYKILYYSNFFPTSDTNIWLHPIQIGIIPERERSRSLEVSAAWSLFQKLLEEQRFLNEVIGTGVTVSPGSEAHTQVNYDPHRAYLKSLLMWDIH